MGVKSIRWVVALRPKFASPNSRNFVRTLKSPGELVDGPAAGLGCRHLQSIGLGRLAPIDCLSRKPRSVRLGVARPTAAIWDCHWTELSCTDAPKTGVPPTFTARAGFASARVDCGSTAEASFGGLLGKTPGWAVMVCGSRLGVSVGTGASQLTGPALLFAGASRRFSGSGFAPIGIVVGERATTE
jgi:hypothetical protein